MEELNEIGRASGQIVMGGKGGDIYIDDLKAYIHEAEEGGYWVEIPALPGCLTQGETLDEVVENIEDAIQGWLSVQTRESLVAHGARVVEKTSLPNVPRRLPRSVRTLEFAA